MSSLTTATNFTYEDEDNLLEDYINSIKQIVIEFKMSKKNNRQTKATVLKLL